MIGVTLTAVMSILDKPVEAALTFSTNRTFFETLRNDSLDWFDVGEDLGFFPFNTLPNSFSTTSSGGITVNVEIPTEVPFAIPPVTPPFIFQTGKESDGLIPTNFAEGDYILFTGLSAQQSPAPGNDGPISLSFDTPVLGLGTQISVDDATSGFNGTIRVFDNSDILLDSFSAPGTASTKLDNSALFLGVFSDIANIGKVEYFSDITDTAIGINQVSFVSSTAIPEPLSILGTLVAGGVGVAMKNRKKKTSSK